MTRSILITGCSTGIGRTAALGMKRRGWTVFATARTPQDIADLEAHGLHALHLDYTDRAAIEAAAAAVLAATDGRLEALFNNGAYGQPGALEDLPTEALVAQFEANFFGWHHLTRLVIPAMRREKRGRIVMNSSILGLITIGFRGAYSCSKFALEAYSDTLRIELAGSGIHVSVIEPGPIRTSFTRTALGHARRVIDLENSVHRTYYRRRLAAMEKGGITFGELGPEAVLDALVRACESRNPRPHYFVTKPTKALGFLRRVLPKRQLHALMVRATHME